MLVSACSLGHTAVARALLQAGADPNARSLDGMPGIFMSAAMAAMKLKIPGRETEAQGSLECLEALLSSGADPNVSAPGGFTPLHVAAEAGSDRMVRALLAAGASTAAKTSAGQTPAAVAATWGHRSLAEALLRHESGPDGVSAQSVDALMAEAEAHAAAQIAARSAAASNSDPATSAGVPQPEDPDDAKSEALKAEGNKAFVAGEFETALAKYHAALRHCTTSPLVWANAAAAALRLGRHAEALKDARVARTLDPTNVKAWYREGQAAEGLGLWEDAAAAYFEAYLVQPGGIGGLDFGAMVKAAVEKGRAAAQGKGS